MKINCIKCNKDLKNIGVDTYFPYHTNDIYCKLCAEKELEKLNKHNIVYLNELEVRTLCYVIESYEGEFQNFGETLKDADNINMAYGIVNLFKKLKDSLGDQNE